MNFELLESLPIAGTYIVIAILMLAFSEGTGVMVNFSKIDTPVK